MFQQPGQPGQQPGDPTSPTGGAPIAGAGGGMFGNPTAPPPNFTGATPEDLCRQPTIAFVVDGSGSMCETFGGSTRWQELRGALLAPQEAPSPGLILRLQARARFGMFIYSGSVDGALALTATGGSPTPMCAGFGGGGGDQCPNMVEVPPAVGNYGAIDGAFPQQEPGGSTPTDKAMNMVVDRLIAEQAMIDTALNPQYIILATDGQPNDICVGGVGGDGLAQQQGVLAAADRAAQAGITTFVISLAGGDVALEQHLTQVAQHGDPTNPMARTYTPATPEDLVATLVALLGSAFGCDIG